jgi:hypothetical protein
MGIANATGAGVPLELFGTSYMASPRLLRHYGEIENMIRIERGNPFDCIRDAADSLSDNPDLMQVFIERAFGEAKKWRSIDIVEMFQWIGWTFKGRAFGIWLSVRDNDECPAWGDFFTLFCDEYEHLMAEGGPEKASAWVNGLEGTIATINGEDELGNSSGSTASQEETEAETTSQ